MKFLNLFKKKPVEEGLDKIKEQNIITKEEWLRIKFMRAEKEFDEYIKDKKTKKIK
jgi:hypothetical protein